MPLIVEWLPKREDTIIHMGRREPDPPPPAVPIVEVEEKSIKQAATTPPVVKTVHKEKKTKQTPGGNIDHA